MPKIVDLHEAKVHLAQLVQRAARGEVFVIAQAGQPLVQVVPFSAPRTRQRLGFLVGAVHVPEDFDRMGERAIAARFGVAP